jgi:hypothetical protein
LVCTSTRVIILKAGWMNGQIFGTDIVLRRSGTRCRRTGLSVSCNLLLSAGHGQRVDVAPANFQLPACALQTGLFSPT